MNGEILSFKTTMKLNNIDKAIKRINKDIDVNERCLKEEMPDDLRRVIELQIEYDYELLKILKRGDSND